MSKPIEAAGRMFVIEGLEEAKAKLRELDPKKMRAAERTALRAAAGLIATAAKRRAPRATGMLATKKIRVGASVTTEQGLTGSHSVLVATVGTNRVGMFQEFGTAAHIIRGRRGRVLKFGGRFVRSVRHPGQAARPFLRPAMEESKDAVVQKYGEAFVKQIAKVTGSG